MVAILSREDELMNKPIILTSVLVIHDCVTTPCNWSNCGFGAKRGLESMTFSCEVIFVVLILILWLKDMHISHKETRNYRTQLPSVGSELATFRLRQHPQLPVLQQDFYVKSYTLLAMGEEYLVILTEIGMRCKADTFVHILWNPKGFCMIVDNYQAEFE